MDGRHFDDLARNLSSRRTAIGGMLAGLLLPFEAAARKKGKDQQRKSKGKGKDKQRVSAQDTCWRAGACIPKKGANVSQCDLANYSPSTTLNCTGCNISRANLRGANLSGANLTKANLSGSCLVDADLNGATVTNATNLYNAIFCRTTMPDGSVNNSGCGSGTPCCPTCDAAHLCASGCCNGLTCGVCPAGSTCGGGNPGIPGICGCTPATCESLGDVCGPNVPDGCGGTLSCGSCGPTTCGGGFCLKLVDGSTLCYSTGVVPRCRPCSSAADCIGDEPYCYTSIVRPTGEIVPAAENCPSQAAVCINVTPC